MLSKLQNSSDKTKRIYALAISGAVTLSIAFVWATLALPSFTDRDETQVIAEERETSPVSVAWARVQAVPQDIIHMLEEANDFFTASSFFESKVEYKAE